MKHSLSELQDYLDSGQLDGAHDHSGTALVEVLGALPDLLKLAKLAFKLGNLAPSDDPMRRQLEHTIPVLALTRFES